MVSPTRVLVPAPPFCSLQKNLDSLKAFSPLKGYLQRRTPVNISPVCFRYVGGFFFLSNACQELGDYALKFPMVLLQQPHKFYLPFYWLSLNLYCTRKEKKKELEILPFNQVNLQGRIWKKRYSFAPPPPGPFPHDQESTICKGSQDGGA